jgi:hypothetical protein
VPPLNASTHPQPCGLEMAAWEPQPEGLHTIVQLLTEFRQPGANQAQARAPQRVALHASHLPCVCAQIFARLEQCSAVPDFNNYLAYVLSRATVRLPSCL